jgi:hypothetical protein
MFSRCFSYKQFLSLFLPGRWWECWASNENVGFKWLVCTIFSKYCFEHYFFISICILFFLILMIQLFFIHFYFLVVPAATDPMLQRTTCFPCCHLKYFILSHFKPVFFWNTLFFIVPFFGNSLFAVPLLLYSFFIFLFSMFSLQARKLLPLITWNAIWMIHLIKLNWLSKPTLTELPLMFRNLRELPPTV